MCIETRVTTSPYATQCSSLLAKSYFSASERKKKQFVKTRFCFCCLPGIEEAAAARQFPLRSKPEIHKFIWYFSLFSISFLWSARVFAFLCAHFRLYCCYCSTGSTGSTGSTLTSTDVSFNNMPHITHAIHSGWNVHSNNNNNSTAITIVTFLLISSDGARRSVLCFAYYSQCERTLYSYGLVTFHISHVKRLERKSRGHQTPFKNVVCIFLCTFFFFFCAGRESIYKAHNNISK